MNPWSNSKVHCSSNSIYLQNPQVRGIKLWSVYDSQTGYLLKFQVYTGREVSDIPGGVLASQVVLSLLGEYENKGRIVFMDNCYCSVPLFETLRHSNTGAFGTVPDNRKVLPLDMKKMKKNGVSSQEFGRMMTGLWLPLLGRTLAELTCFQLLGLQTQLKLR